MKRFIYHIIFLCLIVSACNHSPGRLYPLESASKQELQTKEGRKIEGIVRRLHAKTHFLGWANNPINDKLEVYFQYNIYQEHDFNTYNFEIWEIDNDKPVLRFTQNKYRDTPSSYFYYTINDQLYLIVESQYTNRQFLSIEIYTPNEENQYELIFDLKDYLPKTKGNYNGRLEFANGKLFIKFPDRRYQLMFSGNQIKIS